MNDVYTLVALQQSTKELEGSIMDGAIARQSSSSMSFGPFQLSLPNGPLVRHGSEVALRPKALAVLGLLVEQANQVVNKEELLERVWLGKVVSDGSLAVCIREIREALGDDPREPQYLQTMHGHGYRFIGQVNNNTSGRLTFPGFTGRQTELEILHEEHNRAIRGEARLVLIGGNAGFGKSALINRWCALMETPERARVTYGQCVDQSGVTEAYLPFLTALEKMSAGPDGRQVVATMRKVAPNWLLQLPQLFRDDERETLQAQSFTADTERMKRELVNLFVALTERSPLVLVLEDMHWCDASSAAALAVLARSTVTARLLVIASFRLSEVSTPDHVLAKVRGELKVQGLCTEIVLGPLTRGEVKNYLAEKLTEQSNTALADAVHDRTEGHPLFLATVVEQIRTREDDADWRTELNSIVPADLVTFIELRLAQLDDVERTILEVASIAGICFSIAEIEDALASVANATTIEQVCERLCQRGEFLAEDAPSTWPDNTLTACYVFRHALYPEIIRSAISGVRKIRTHKAIGERLVSGYKAETHTIASRLAFHFEHSQDIPRTLEYLMAAAEVAGARHAHIESAQLLRRGLVLVDKIKGPKDRAALQLNLLLALGPVLASLEGYGADTVELTFSQARRLCSTDALAEYRFPVLRGLASFYLLRADYATAYELGSELRALEPTHGVSQDSLLTESHFVCGVVDFFSGRFTDASRELQQTMEHHGAISAVDHAHVHGLEPGTIATSFDAISNWVLGKSAHSAGRVEEALILAKSVDHPVTRCQCESILALLCQWRGDLEQTRVHATLAMELATQHGFSYLIASEQARLGWLLVQNGEIASGIEEIRQGISHYTNTGAIGGLTAIIATLAEAYLIGGEIDEGLQAVHQALELARDNKEGLYEAELLRLNGELLLRLLDVGNRALAEEIFNAAIMLARQQKARCWEIRARVSLAGLMFDANRRDEMRDLLIPKIPIKIGTKTEIKTDIQADINEYVTAQDLPRALQMLESASQLRDASTPHTAITYTE